MRLPIGLITFLLVLIFNGTSSEAAPLKEGDVVGVNVFGELSLSGAFTIGPKGAIAFPLLGNITAAGESANDLASTIKAALEKDYIRSAQVAVALTGESKAPPQTVTVIGMVNKPQQVAFPASGLLDIYTAIASAGGLAEKADRSSIELKRRTGEILSTQNLSIDNDRVFKLQDGDILVVGILPQVNLKATQPQVTVLGQVKKPGLVKINPRQPLDVIAAIAAVEGFTDKARPSKVIVRRMTTSGMKVYELNVGKMQRGDGERFILKDGDTITVSESIF